MISSSLTLLIFVISSGARFVYIFSNQDMPPEANLAVLLLQDISAFLLTSSVIMAFFFNITPKASTKGTVEQTSSTHQDTLANPLGSLGAKNVDEIVLDLQKK